MHFSGYHDLYVFHHFNLFFRQLLSYLKMQISRNMWFSLMFRNIHICGIYFFRYKNMVILTKIVKTRRLKVQIKVGLKNWSFQDLPRNISLNFDCRKSRHQDSPAEGAINLYKSQLTIFRAGYFYYVNGRGAKNIPLGSTQKWCQMFV